MAKTETEVKAKLTLTDGASATLAKLKGGFQGLNAVVDNTARGVFDFGKQVAAVAIGVNLGSILGSIRDIGTSAFAAASAGQLQMRELGKAMAGLASAKGAGMGDFVRAAESVYDRLSAVARQGMVARDELVSAFSETAKSTTLTSSALTKLIADVAGASRALPAPIAQVVQGFEQFRKNVISSDNPLVTMIKQANLMRGHTEQITLRLQAMGRHRALTLAGQALRVMQERAKALPPTLDDMTQQLDDMRTDVLRTAGTPMLQALMPAFSRLQKLIAAHREEIVRYARAVGQHVGQWIVAAAQKIAEGFRYIDTHSAEIKQSIMTAFSYAKSVWEFIMRHKLAIGGAMVASRVAPAAASAGSAVAGAAGGLISLARTGIPALGIAASSAATGVAGATLALGSFVAAVGSVAAAVMQYTQLLEETSGTGLTGALGGGSEDAANAEARKKAIEAYASSFQPADDATRRAFEAWGATVKANAEHLGMTAESARAFVASAAASHDALVKATDGMRRAAEQARAIPDATAATVGAVAAQELEVAKAFAASYNAAAKSGNTAALNASVSILAGSKGLQAAILKAGSLAGLSLDQLADQLGLKLGEFGDKLREQAGIDAEKNAQGEKGAVPLNVFNGGQTFNIKQDFRDQDPDRIAVVFERDIARAAQNRLQARSALPFGG